MMALSVHTKLGRRHDASGMQRVVQSNEAPAMQAALKQANIVPSAQPVSTADVTQALTDAFGFAPILHCHNDHSSGNSYIDEVMPGLTSL